MVNRFKSISLLIALAFILTIFIVPGPAKANITDIELVAGKYTGTNTYVPGEIMSIVITGDTEGEEFVVYSVPGDEVIIPGGNIIIPASGSFKLSYEVPNVPDGEYLIRVKRKNGATEAEAPFNVQGYSFQIETDRAAYLREDEMRVFWTANNLKDQTLPSAGVGKIQIWVQNPGEPGNITQMVEAHRFNISAGSVSFKLPSIVDYGMNYYVDGWFNSSSISPLRSQYSRADFSIKRLGVITTLDKDQYAAGSLMSLTVRTYATDNQANPSSGDSPEPECNVSIGIKRLGSLQYTYPTIILRTDSQGVLKHIIALNNDTYVEDTMFEVEIYASKGTTNSVPDSQTFEIVSSSSISIVLDFSRAQYASGETLYVNATASAIGDAPSSQFTYILEIRAQSSNGSLYARDTQLHGNFSFEIPDNFEGLLWVKVTADDGAGNSASVIQQVSVAYAIVLVNSDRDYYESGDVMEISYSIVGNMEDEPDTFFIVYDSDGNVVKEGITGQGSFEFEVPSAPSNTYTFTVFASAGGRMVQGTDTAYLFSGFLLNLKFNRAYYKPGDIIAVDYSIIVLGGTNMPASFIITYGLVNGPVSSLQITETTGTLLYTVPDDLDEGNQMFMASCNFGTAQVSASEVVLIKSGANPLWFLSISDIPVFSVGLLLLVVISLVYSYRTRKRVKALESEGVYQKQAPAESLISKRVQDSQGHVVECVECGNPIEITTTRRPIEVMCPHCGEIQHIE